jgi:hypothetical protein
MNDNLKAALIQHETACLAAKTAGYQAENSRIAGSRVFFTDMSFVAAADDSSRKVESILQEKSEDGQFRFPDVKPNDDAKSVLYWNVEWKTWCDCRVERLADGDIWRYQPPEPTELL